MVLSFDVPKFALRHVSLLCIYSGLGIFEVEFKMSISSINCFIKAPCVAALHTQTVSDSVELRATSADWPDFAATAPWSLLKKKKNPPVDIPVSSSSA